MSRLPNDVQALLRDRIESFEQLETLLLVRLEPERWWTADAVAQRLNLAPALAIEAIEHLRRQDLVDHRPDSDTRVFRYRAWSSDLDETIRRLENLYAGERLEVMRALNENAIHRVRTQAIQTFADTILIDAAAKRRRKAD